MVGGCIDVVYQCMLFTTIVISKAMYDIIYMIYMYDTTIHTMVRTSSHKEPYPIEGNTGNTIKNLHTNANQYTQ